MSDRFAGQLPGRDTETLARLWRQVRFNPLNTTPKRLTADLDAFEAGWVRNAALLWEAIEQRDDMASAVVPKRKKAVSRRPWEIVMVDDSGAAEDHKETLEAFYNNLTVTDALDLNVRGQFPLLIRQMMDAQFKRYAVHEIIWKPGKMLGAELRFCPLYLFENTIGRLRYTGPLGVTNGTELPADEWMITVGDGLMRAISVCWMFKKFSLQDWLNFSEKFGMPGIHGETPAAKGSPEWNDFVNGLEKFANDWIIATAAGCKINLIEAGKTGEAPFRPMVDRMDQAIARLVRGADLATMSQKDAAGASLQADETNLLEEDDCALISETLNVHLGRLVIEYTFGRGVKPLAYLLIKPTPQTDVRVEMDVDKHLKEMGVPQSIEDMAERYGRTLPDDGEELVDSGHQGKEDDVPQGAENEAAPTVLREAVFADLEPVYLAIAEVLAAKGDDEMEARLEELTKAWPGIIEAVLAGDSVEKALESRLSAAFVQGLDLTELAREGLGNGGFNPAQLRDLRGQWTDMGMGGGGSAREPRTRANRDAFGERLSKDITPAANLERGKNALEWALRNKQGVQRAMWRPEVGAIDFVWGTPGDRFNDYAGGSGLSHIIAKHGEEDARKLPAVLLQGQMIQHPDDPTKQVITHGHYTAILTHKRDKGRRYWVLTGFTDTKPKP